MNGSEIHVNYPGVSNRPAEMTANHGLANSRRRQPGGGGCIFQVPASALWEGRDRERRRKLLDNLMQILPPRLFRAISRAL